MIKENNFDEQAKKIKLKWFALFFVIILIIVGYIAFASDLEIPFTGNQIKNTNPNNSIEVNANLDLPKLEINGKFNEIRIINPKDSTLFVGNAKFKLDNEIENTISIENFNGKINFDSEKISLMEGKTTRVIVNNVPILPESGETSKIRFENQAGYKSLSIGDNLIIEDLSYKTSGLIELISSGDILTIKEEEVRLRNFVGSLNSELGKLNITGKLKELEIKSDKIISIKA